MAVLIWAGREGQAAFRRARSGSGSASGGLGTIVGTSTTACFRNPLERLDVVAEWQRIANPLYGGSNPPGAFFTISLQFDAIWCGQATIALGPCGVTATSLSASSKVSVHFRATPDLIDAGRTAPFSAPLWAPRNLLRRLYPSALVRRASSPEPCPRWSAVPPPNRRYQERSGGYTDPSLM